ncbi:patched domain-containing protein 3-like, partial [Saccoglossus kowalevskii]|uniref:Patched domain-containing protein 3-like n=1 Tax=Saccoglossus kowalevskii TaxID=10224 RepID=A0ABM0MT68_SACKO
MCYCDCRCDCVERRLSRLFYQYGKFIARHPIPFVVVPLIVAAALGAGLLTLTNETDPEYLFAPADSRAQSDRARLGELFPNDDATQFNSARLNNLGRFGRVIITASDGGNVLREGIFSEVIKVNDFIVDINITVDGETLRFDNDLCAKWLDQCSLNDIIGLYNFSSTNADNINITYPTTGQIFIGGALGGVAFYSDQETVKSALAIQLHYFLKSGDEELELQSDMWELEFMNSMFVYESDNIDVAYYTSQTLELELEASITSVFPLFTITFTLLITFSIVCCIMADWVRSKPMLGQLGVLSAGLAIVSSLGLMSYCGVPFINVVASMPFLILGIGVDDMFIMIAAWRKT